MLTTQEFLALVVPEQGQRIIAIHRAPGMGMAHHFADDHEDMAVLIENYASRPVNVYHANATFRGRERKADQALFMRALWLDLDVLKAEGKSYPSQQAAFNALKDFLRASHFSKPSLVISSGTGLHVYWCFDADLEAGRWWPMAKALKALTAKHGLMADPTVTADRARILRPVGTTWYDFKGGTDRTLPVRAVYVNPDRTYPVSVLELPLLGSKPLEALTSGAPRIEGLRPDPAANAALRAPAGSVDYTGSKSLEVAKRCGQIHRFRQSGDLPYDLWRLCVGVLVRTDDGERYIHEWSANDYPNYDREETQQKIDTWNVEGATRCDSFAATDPSGPCSTCPHRGKLNSPWVLGLPRTAPVTTYTPPETHKPEVFEPVGFPEKAWVNERGQLWINLGGDSPDSRVEAYACNLPFYFTTIAVRPDGRLESDAVFFPRKNERREFTFPHEIAQDQRALVKFLNGYGIYGTGKVVGAYIVSYLDTLKQHVEDTHTYQQMGWVKGGQEFLIGDTVITPEGDKPVRVSGHMASKSRLFDASKDPQQWVDAVDQLYNLPHGQPYQFAICAGFGSVLVPVLNAEEFNGIPVALTSDESGFGKSTVCKIALSAFGRVERNVNVLTGDEVSSGAVEVQCSTFNNVPHLFDEMTNKSAQDTSHILYMLSNGVARARLKQDGTPRPPSPPWRGISFITGNKNIFLKLTESKVNPEAAQMRVFEIPLDIYPKLESLTHAADYIELANEVRSGYGAVGVAFTRFVMENQKKVSKQLWALVNLISKREGVRHGKERFYIYEIACAIVAGKILKHLGLVAFDIERLFTWAFLHMANMRDTTNEHQRSAAEDFALMLATFAGEGRVMSTCIHSSTHPEFPLRGVPVMRLLRDQNKAYLTVEGFNRYCVQVSKSPAKFRQELIDAGCFDPESIRQIDGRTQLTTTNFALASGILGMAMGTSKCYQLNFHKAIGPVIDRVEALPSNVITMKR